MNQLHLVVDVGNSHTVLGVFKGDDLLHRWRVTTRNERTRDELMLQLQGLLQSEAISKGKEFKVQLIARLSQV